MNCIYCGKELTGIYKNLYMRREPVQKDYLQGALDQVGKMGDGIEALGNMAHPDPIGLAMALIMNIAGDAAEGAQAKRKPVYVKQGNAFYPHHRLIGMAPGAGAYRYYPAKKAAFERLKAEQQTTRNWYHLNLFGKSPTIYKLPSCLPCFQRRKDQFPEGTFDTDHAQLHLPNNDRLAYEKPIQK
jgi:hypothetical protein